MTSQGIDKYIVWVSPRKSQIFLYLVEMNKWVHQWPSEHLPLDVMWQVEIPSDTLLHGQSLIAGCAVSA